MIELIITIDEKNKKLKIDKTKENRPTNGDRYVADMFLALTKGIGERNPLKYFSVATNEDVAKMYSGE